MISLKIAYRYLRAPKSHSAVNIITNVSIAGVAVATMAMVVVLSIFNGFADLAAGHLSMLDADLTVSRTDSKVIADGDSLARMLDAVPGVRAACPVVTGRALMVGSSTQTPVQFRGVPQGYDTLTDIHRAIIDGCYASHTTAGTPVALISVGVANNMQLTSTSPESSDLHLYVPRRAGRINPANPAASFIGQDIAVSGVFSVSQPEYDTDYMIVPLETARELLDYYTEASDIEIYLDDNADIGRVRRDISRTLNDDAYTVRDSLQLHAEAFRMISIEKWVTFMMLIFILVIALFNIVSTLSLLVIEKRHSMDTLRYLGAPRHLITRVFVTEGWIVTAIGGAIGLAMGIILTLIQQWGHVIKLSADAAALTIDHYPVRLSPVDLLAVAAAVALTGLIASQTTRLFSR